MKKVIILNEETGYKEVYLVRDNDEPEMAAEIGIPLPLVVDHVDWEEVKRTLNNLLVERGLLTIHDIDGSGNLQNAILLAIRKPLLQQYRALEGGTQ